MAESSHKIILNAFKEIGASVNQKLNITGLNDTPTGYLGHSGDYLVVNDGESGIHFTGIEKIASDLTDYGFGGGSLDIPKYTDLPDATANDGKIVASGCDLYYGCDGEWKKIGADSIPPPENIPGCISNLQEYNQYQEYKEQFLADNLNNSFSNGFLGLDDPSELIYDVCLFSDSDLSSVKIDETTYKWGMFANTQTVNITATPGVASDREIQFSHWAGDGAVFGDASSSQTTLLVDKDLSVTGYFSEILEATCEDVALHIQSDTTNGSTTFTDLSSNAHAITIVGDIKHSTTDTYLGTTSMSFDGAGDYLQVGDTTTFKFLHDASTDYTVEGWFYIDSSILTSNTVHRIMGHVINSSSDVAIDFFVREDTLGSIEYNIHRGTIGTVHRGVSTQAGAFVKDQWNHVAVVYTINNQPKIYLNGQDTQATPDGDFTIGNASASNSTDRLTIGAFGPGGNTGEKNWWPGMMQDLRITKKAIYTGNFSPPTMLHDIPCPQPICSPRLLQKFMATDTVDGDHIGISVSVDGDRLAVGAYGDDDAGDNSGSVYIFELQNGTWTQTYKFHASNTAANDLFGTSVSLDGDRLAVGANLSNYIGTDSGIAYIFELKNGVWTEIHKIIAADSTSYDNFGVSVSLDGDRLAVGAHADDDAGDNSGSVYIFELQNGTWKQTHKFRSTDTVAYDYFGVSVSLEGDRLAIGAHSDDDAGQESGSVYIFELQNGTWTQTHKFLSTDTVAGDGFGISVSLLGDRLAVGAPSDDDAGQESGSVYIFELQNGTWTQTHKFQDADTVTDDQFGSDVSLQGNRLVVGAWLDDDAGQDSGSVYMYSLSCDHIKPACEEIELHVQSDTTDGDMTFVDQSSNRHDITVFGDTQHTTTAAHLGATSISFDGDGDYLSIPQSETLNLQGDFTLECWVKINDESNNTAEMIITSWSNRSSTSEKWQLIRYSDSNTSQPNHQGHLSLHIYVGSTQEILKSNTRTPFDTWVHVAVVGIGDVLSLYVDGQVQSSTTGWSSQTYSLYDSIRVASREMQINNSTPYTDMNLQDLRISKKAIYTSNFTPPNSLLNNPC